MCQRIDRRRCVFIVRKGNENIKLGFKIPFLKTKNNTWRLVHGIKRVLEKKGFDPTEEQISSALSVEYPSIPHIFYD